MHGSRDAWIVGVMSIVVIAFSVSGIFSGEVYAGYGSVKRSENPLYFWLAVVVPIVFGVVGIVFVVGDVFGIMAIEQFAN